MDYETLFIRFKADTSDLDKGSKKAKKTTDDLRESISATDKYTEKLTESFTGLVKSVAGFVAAGLSASALFSGLKNAAEYTTALGYQADQLGVNATMLQAYDQALAHTGGKSGEYAENIKALSKNFGVSPEMAMNDVMPLLADLFPKLNQRQRMVYGEAIGITPAFIQLLAKGKSGLHELIEEQKKLGLLSPEEYKKFEEINGKFADASFALRNAFARAVLLFSPQIETALNGFVKGLEWLKSNGKTVKIAFEGIAIGVGALAAALVLANIEFIGIAASIALIIEAMTKLMALFDEFSAFEDSRKDAVGSINDSWRGSNFGLNDKDNNVLSKSWASPFHLASNPINNDNTNTIASSIGYKNISNDNRLTITGNTIQTQASDPQKFLSDMDSKSLKRSVWKLNNTVSSGVLI